MKAPPNNESNCEDRKQRLRMLGVNQLVAAMIAFDPLLFRQGRAGERPDGEHFKKVFARLHIRQAGAKWAVVDSLECAVSIYDDLLEAAEDNVPERTFLTACKVEDEVVYLSVDGKWVNFSSCRASE